mgnify:CR=1 FL=1
MTNCLIKTKNRKPWRTRWFFNFHWLLRCNLISKKNCMKDLKNYQVCHGFHCYFLYNSKNIAKTQMLIFLIKLFAILQRISIKLIKCCKLIKSTHLISCRNKIPRWQNKLINTEFLSVSIKIIQTLKIPFCLPWHLANTSSLVINIISSLIIDAWNFPS